MSSGITPAHAVGAPGNTTAGPTSQLQDAQGGVMDTDTEMVGGNGRNFKALPGADFLMKPDAILAKDVEKHIQKFLDAGGTEAEAFHLLADSYEGVPDMIGTITGWAEIMTSGSRSGAGLPFGGDALLEKALEDVLDEHEGTVVQRADLALQNVERPPEFLRQLNESPRWNPVVARMGRKHKSSALFNFLARSDRLQKAGIDHDVVSEPAQFLNALSDAVMGLLNNSSITPKDVSEYFNHIRSLGAYDEACAAIAGRLFAHLAREVKDPFTRSLYRRSAQEIRTEAVRVMQTVAGVDRSIAIKFSQRLAIVLECVAAKHPIKKNLLDAVVALLSPDRPVAHRGFESECKIVNETYEGLLGEQNQANGGAVPMDVELTLVEAEKRESLISILIHGEVFQAIIHSLFTVKGRSFQQGGVIMHTDRRDSLCLLLAYAATMGKISPAELTRKMQNKQELAQLRNRATKLRSTIHAVVKICEDLVPGSPRYKYKGNTITTLVAALEEPVLSAGILEWAREGLQGGDDERTLLVTTPKHLAFVEGIAEKHPSLREQCLLTIHNGFGRVYTEQLTVLDAEKLRDMYMDSLVAMVPLFLGSQVIGLFLRDYASDPKVDETHLRRFARGLLEMIAPPYERSFADGVAELLRHNRVKEVTDKETSTQNLVLGFWKQYGEMTANGQGAAPAQMTTGNNVTINQPAGDEQMDVEMPGNVNITKNESVVV